MQKFFKIKYARAISQIVFFIMYPGLFALSFSKIGNTYSMIINGTGNIYSELTSILSAGILLVLTATLGRFFCGWMCSFGAMNDLLYYLKTKVFKIKFKIKITQELDFMLKKLKYIVLLFIFVVFWTFGAKFSFNTNPWTSFANIISIQTIIPSISLGLLFLVIIMIGDFFIERFFCRYLCPLGAIFVMTSKLKFVHIKKPISECGNCKACTVKCSMGLSLYKQDKVTDGDCINCFKCVDICPKNNATVSLGRRAINTITIAAISILSFLALYNIEKPLAKALNQKLVASELAKYSNNSNSNITFNNNSSNNSSSSNANASNNSNTNGSNTNSDSSASTSNASSTNSGSTSTAKYTPGTYTGNAFGYISNIEVSVSVSSNRIDNVVITQINDTPGYYEQPVALIPEEIIGSQSTNVDVVSGATYSSNGIINAVKKALSKAKS